jgi:ribose transport system substrate-binding protein
MKKKIISMLLIATLVLTFAACGDKGSDTDTSTTPPPASDDSATPPPADNSSLNIQVIAKGFQHQFWQVVKQGAQDAADELGVKMEFNGPGAESDIAAQIGMIDNALAQNPSAIALAALDTKSVEGQLADALSKKIPIIGFDSGVPDAPADSIAATASTDNNNAAAIAAQEMMKDSAFKAAVEGATSDKPVVIGILSQDATSTSIIGRTQGYLDEIKAELEAIPALAGKISVTGHDMYKAPVDGAAVEIAVQVPPTSDAADMKNGAQALLSTKGLIGVFLSNEGAVTGFLNATNDGADLGDGKAYADLVVAGFDAGKTQKEVVKQGLFLGSVTQDPYQIGYQAVTLAVQAANGQPVSDVDTGAKWYNAANMDDPSIKDLIYD